MSKRILIYATAYYPFVGGAEVAVKEITDRLGEDYEFDMVTTLMDKKLPRKEKIGNVTVHRVGLGHPKMDKLYLASYGHRKGLKLHKKNKYDVVWALMASFGGFGAAKFKQKARIKYLLTLQEGDPIEVILKKVAQVRAKFNKIFASADALQSISNYLHNWGKEMGFKGSIDEVIPNGVDVSLFDKDYPEKEIQEFRKSLGFPVDSIIISTASRLEVKNGTEDVIRALKLLPEKYCYYICGIGELETQLKDLVRELNLEKRVNFAGFKDHQILPKILKASDIFIRPSISEGLGNSFLEAMATGIPTIGTLVGGIPDFLTNGVTGLVCEPGNKESIAKALKRAGEMSDSEKKALHQNAMKIINEKYNWEYISTRMNYIFTELLNF